MIFRRRISTDISKILKLKKIIRLSSKTVCYES